jgi:hypothetical protein
MAGEVKCPIATNDKFQLVLGMKRHGRLRLAGSLPRPVFRKVVFQYFQMSLPGRLVKIGTLACRSV